MPDTPPQTLEVPIRFGAAMSDSATAQPDGTRATRTGLEELTTPITAFKIFGYKNTTYTADGRYGAFQQVFPAVDGYTVTFNDASAGSTLTNTAGWDYVDPSAGQTIKYWDQAAAAYRFMGYALPTGAQVPTPSTPNPLHQEGTEIYYHRFPIVVNDAIISGDLAPYITHLWMSNGNETMEDPSAPGRNNASFRDEVQLTFFRPLSRVRFIITGLDGQPLSASQVQMIGNLSFGRLNADPIRTNGTITVFYPLTGADPRTESGSFASTYYTAPTGESYFVDAAAGGLTALTTREQWYTVLPAFGQGAFRLSLTQNGNPLTATVPAEMMRWLPGYAYTYVFKLGEVSLSYVSTYFIHTQWQAGYTEGTTTW